MFIKNIEMLKNYKLLLDNECPMCNLYGQCFVKFKLIDASALTSYQEESTNEEIDIDRVRAKSEIAFYNIKTQQTVYGVDALVRIVAQDSKILNWFFNLNFIRHFLRAIYFFISYNRKQIIPVKGTNDCKNCTPEFKLIYRWAYIIFSAFTTAIILSVYFNSVFVFFNIKASLLNEYFICFGQIAWQWIAIKVFNREKWIDYLGNMSTVSMLGGLLLIPVIFLGLLIHIPVEFKLIYFMCVVSIMILEHLRRCTLLDITHFMTMSWVGYRVFVLIVMFFFII